MAILFAWFLAVFLTTCGGSSGGGGGIPPSGTTGVEPFTEDSKFSEVHETENITLDDGRVVEAAKDEILIFAKEDITSEEVNTLKAWVEKLGGIIIGSLTEMRTIQVRIPSTTKETDFISQIKSVSGVAHSGVNLVVKLTDDNLTGYERFLKNVKNYGLKVLRAVIPKAVAYPDFEGNYWIEHIKANEAWEITTGSESDDAIIGIVDTGIMKDQNVLSESRIKRYDYAGNPIEDDDTKDLSDHGMWVTSFAAGYIDESNKVRGVAWKNHVIMADVGNLEQIYIIFKKMTITETLTGIKTAITKGAKIVNISIGAGGIGCSTSSQKRINALLDFRKYITPAVAAAKKNNCLLIFAAGNECEKTDDTLLPSDYNAPEDEKDSWKTHALRVAATDINKKDVQDSILWDLITLWGSNMGKAVDIASPGNNIGWGNGTGSGTSYAAPLVTGTAALLKSINTTLSAPEIRYILLDSADPVVVPSTEALNQGNTKPEPNLFLNAKKAVDNAKAVEGISLDVLDTVIISKDETKSVSFSVTIPPASVSSMDVLFLIDTTGSYYDDIDTLQSKATEIIHDLSTRGIDVQFGVASFADFPFYPYGDESSGDRAFYLNQAITDNIDAVKAAINQLDNPLHYGADWPESQLEALYQAATGSGRDLNNDGDFDDLGEVNPINIGWRTASLKVIVLATDAPFHDPEKEVYYGPTFSQVIDALNAKGIIVIGLDSGDTQGDLQRIVDATKGSLFALSSNSSEIAEAIIEGIEEALAEVTLSVERISGGEWIFAINPDKYSGVKPGETRTFTVTLNGIKNKGVSTLTYDVYLWIKADSGLLKRVRIPIAVLGS